MINLMKTRKMETDAYLNEDETKEFRAVVGQINWVCSQTRPDAAFDMLHLSTQMKHPKVKDALYANKVVRKLKGSDSYVSYKHLGTIERLKIVVFCDASWANLPDGVSSAGGYVILLMGDDSKCCPLDWSSTKIKRVVHSTLSAEALAMLESVDNSVFT